VKLEARNVTAGYGRVAILHDVSLSIPERGIVTILGPNGAGKSTLLRALAGQIPLMSGDRLLDGASYARSDATSTSRAGVALVPQTDAVFADLTVEDNLRIGAHGREDADEAIAEVVSRFPILDERLEQAAGSLSGGERQLLAVSAALLMRPSVLLLDEPTTGLAPTAAAATAGLIADTAAEGTAVAWVVEQSPELALERADRAYFVEAGQIRFEGEARSLMEADRLEALMLQRA
jgi:branched-chain amino acid transport system ATP-binding protein